MVSDTWSAPTTIRWVKLCVVTACCPGAGMMNMFGKPCVVMPWRLRTPSFHFSSIVMPSRPTMVCPARRANGVSSPSKPVASTMQSTSYSSPFATTPCFVTRVTPLGAVDQRDLRVVERDEVLVVEAGPLAAVAVVRLEHLRGRGVTDERLDALAVLLHDLRSRWPRPSPRCPSASCPRRSSGCSTARCGASSRRRPGRARPGDRSSPR